MRKITAAVFVSLDGVMQAPGGPDEDTDSGFTAGGWVFHYFDEATGGVMDELFERKFDLLLGRKTYDIFAGYWPKQGADDPIGKLFNSVTKYVATHGHQKLDWENSQSLGSDVVATLRELKASDGPELLIQGSADLIQTLIEHDLIDEYRLLIFPVLLGKGKRLFGDGTVTQALNLMEQRTFPNGVMLASYVPAGELKTGSFV
ncbi:dihydrofolate reductase family protein [Rhizobium sp. TH2]|uniref:dihydrofolate reductase family protein n=1 Tax=Rhizobium sp. TH2 TaxID=2775403 RepID=UPI002156FA99|nr:dihydrofolate reductase family protein [Rhizobium sp. TH2]UVC11871.1 dihydrofolate reductase family protein [Rhizobium sp. TH2]